MTKAELEARNAELEEKLKEQEHLASAVQAKDLEISELKEKETANLVRIRDLERKVKEQEHLASAVQAKDIEIANLKEKHAKEFEKKVFEEVSKGDKLFQEQVEKNKKLEKKIEDIQNAHQEEKESMEKFMSSLASEYKDTLDRYNSLLKILQGTTDSHIELHELSQNKLYSHFPNAKR